MVLETKQKELDLVRKEKTQSAKLPKLTITPFRGTTRDWIRFLNQYNAQVDNQPVSKTVKFGYLVQLVTGSCCELIGNIPNTDDGYDRALELLRKEFGQNQAVIAAHTKEIIEMGVVHGTKYSRIKEFYDMLSINYEALRAMDAHKKVEGLVLSTLEKLPHVKPDLARNDENWEQWTYEQLLEEVRKWLKRNQTEETTTSRRTFDNQWKSGGEKRNRRFLTSEDRFQPRGRSQPRCFYCPKQHWPDQCDAITDVVRQKEFLKRRGLCYKCGDKHMVKDCVKCGCFRCKGNHHVSIHEDRKCKTNSGETETEDVIGYMLSGQCVMPLIPFDIKETEIWGILDTGSTKNYITAKAVDMLKLRPDRWEETTLRTAEGTGRIKKKPVYNVCTYTRSGEKVNFAAVGLDQENFSIVERESSKKLRERYQDLQGLYIPDSKSGKYEIHLLIGDPLFSRVRTGRSIKGRPGEPMADETLFGWTVHGEQTKLKQSYFTRTTSQEYEKLYQLDILGVEDHSELDQNEVKKEFLENIQRNKDGCYQIRILWIEGRTPQEDNLSQSRARLNNLFR